VKPTVEQKRPDGSILPYWGFYPGSATSMIKDDDVIPVAFVALTPVKFHFSPHYGSFRRRWHNLIMNGEFQGDKVFGTTVFKGPNMRNYIEDSKATRIINLLAGDVIVTHSGMPFYFSNDDDDFVVQGVFFF